MVVRKKLKGPAPGGAGDQTPPPHRRARRHKGVSLAPVTRDWSCEAGGRCEDVRCDYGERCQKEYGE